MSNSNLFYLTQQERSCGVNLNTCTNLITDPLFVELTIRTIFTNNSYIIKTTHHQLLRMHQNK